MKCPNCLFSFIGQRSYPGFWRAERCSECGSVLIRKPSLAGAIITIAFILLTLVITVNGGMETYWHLSGVVSIIISLFHSYSFRSYKIDDGHIRGLREKTLIALLIIVNYCGMFNFSFIDNLNVYFYHKIMAHDVVYTVNSHIYPLRVLAGDKIVFESNINFYLRQVYMLDVNKRKVREVKPFYRYIFEGMYIDGQMLKGAFSRPGEEDSGKYEVLSVNPDTLQVVKKELMTKQMVHALRKNKGDKALSFDRRYKFANCMIYDQQTGKKIDTISEVAFENFAWAPDRNRLYYLVNNHISFYPVWVCYRDYPEDK